MNIKKQYTYMHIFQHNGAQFEYKWYNLQFESGNKNFFMNKMSFFVQLRNYFIFFIVFGLWSSKHNQKYKILSRISSAISISFFLIAFSLTIETFPDFSTLSNVVANVLYVFLFLTHLIILLESVVKIEAQAKLIDILSSVDHLFHAKIGIAIPYRWEKSKIFNQTLILVLIEVTIKLIIIIIVFSRYAEADKSFKIFFALYSNFVICLRMIQIIIFVHLLQDRLILLNQELIDLFDTTQHKKNRTIPFFRYVFVKCSMYDRVLSLKQIYSKLFDISEQISDAFGWSLLLVVIVIFTTVTFDFYWAYINRNDAAFVLNCLLFFVPYLIILSTLTYYCSSCCQQVHIIIIICRNVQGLFF